MSTEKKCSACGGTKFLRYSPLWHGDEPICNPCFLIWYEYGETDPVKVGELSHKLKSENKWPWNGGRYGYTDVPAHQQVVP